MLREVAKQTEDYCRNQRWRTGVDLRPPLCRSRARITCAEVGAHITARPHRCDAVVSSSVCLHTDVVYETLTAVRPYGRPARWASVGNISTRLLLTLYSGL